MSEQLTFIPASEAAALAGVTPETIRNLCKAKTIRYQMRTNLFYVCREDVEKYAQSISEVNEIERSIEDYKKEINKAYEQIRDAKQEMQDRLEDMNMFPERIKNITNLLMSLIPHFVTNLTEREMEIVMLVLQGEKISDVALKMQLTRDRTRQIWEKAIRKMSYFPNELRLRDEEDSKEVKSITQKQQEQRTQAKEPEKVSHEAAILLTDKIIDRCAFTTRTHNGLISAEIRTIGDLTTLRRIDLQNIRNFGPKSVSEVEEWLTAHNLSLAENIPGKYVETHQRRKHSRKQ